MAGGAAALQSAQDANFKASQLACETLWESCEAALAEARGGYLPSAARFEHRIGRCNATMARCVGPTAAGFARKMHQLAAAKRAEFDAEFDAALSRAVFVGALAGALFFRFIHRVPLLELACFALLLLVEVLPKFLPLYGGPSTVWRTERGARLLDAYEAIVFNQLWDLNEAGPLALLVGVPLLVVCKLWRWARRPRLTSKKHPSFVAPGPQGAGSAALTEVLVVRDTGKCD